MSISDDVDSKYRLHPTDLGGRPRTALICRVGYEGVEEMTPLLHFEGIARPLALDAEQRIQMAGIARSTLTADWVGMALVLRPAREGGEETIRLLALDARSGAVGAGRVVWRRPRSLKLRPLLRVLLLLLLLAVVYAAVTQIEQGVDLGALLESLSR